MKPGEVVADRFQVEKLAGSGGMGAVFRARDLTTGETVALKSLHDPGGTHVERFLREAQVLAELHHPGIVRYISHGRSKTGELYMAMEWVEGESLSQRAAKQPFTVREAVQVVIRIARALADAHTHGIVHRDIKPSNLFIPFGTLEVKVLDFGIARLTQAARLTGNGMMLGTPGYMAPEQARGAANVDARADVFSLGCVLFRSLTGRPPFMSEDVRTVLAQVLYDPAPPVSSLRPEVPPALDAFVQRMLAKKPADRPADAIAVANELEAMLPSLIDLPARQEGAAAFATPAPATPANPFGVAAQPAPQPAPRPPSKPPSQPPQVVARPAGEIPVAVFPRRAATGLVREPPGGGPQVAVSPFPPRPASGEAHTALEASPFHQGPPPGREAPLGGSTLAEASPFQAPAQPGGGHFASRAMTELEHPVAPVVAALAAAQAAQTSAAMPATQPAAHLPLQVEPRPVRPSQPPASQPSAQLPLPQAAPPARDLSSFLAAAEEALSRNQLPAAISTAERGLRLPGGADHERGGLSAASAEAHLWRGENVEAERGATQALAALPLDAPAWGRSAALLATASARRGDGRAAANLARLLLEMEPLPSAGALRAAAACASALLERGQLELATQLEEKVKAGAAGLDAQPDVQGALLELFALVSRARGDLSAAWRGASAAADRLRAAGQERAAALAQVEAAAAHARLGRLEEALTALQPPLEEARHQGVLVTWARAAAERASVLVRLDRAEEALAEARSAVQAAAPQSYPVLKGWAQLALAQALAALDRRGDAESAASEAHAQLAGTPHQLSAQALLARIRLERGGRSQALELARATAEALAACPMAVDHEAEALLTLCQALFASGLRDHGREALRQGVDLLKARAAAISAPSERQPFLTRRAEHVRLLELAAYWLGQAG